jgi:hypothetical protein
VILRNFGTENGKEELGNDIKKKNPNEMLLRLQRSKKEL